MTRRWFMATAMVGFAALAAGPASAGGTYDPGASDTEIRIGNIMPYSGPASAYSAIGKAEAAYFKRINDEEASTAARSPSSPMMTPTARQRPWSRRASWSKATRSW